jgi:hypothetical protein
MCAATAAIRSASPIRDGHETGAIVPSIALLGGTAFFLWMFLAVAPLESLGDSGGFSGTDLSRVAATSYRFAADWRHGMAGNSPLYMPGFFGSVTASRRSHVAPDLIPGRGRSPRRRSAGRTRTRAGCRGRS